MEGVTLALDRLKHGVETDSGGGTTRPNTPHPLHTPCVATKVITLFLLNQSLFLKKHLVAHSKRELALTGFWNQ